MKLQYIKITHFFNISRHDTSKNNDSYSDYTELTDNNEINTKSVKNVVV